MEAHSESQTEIQRTPGRPSSYRPEWCEQVIELGRIGKSICQIAAALDVDRKTLANLAGKHPELADALHRSRELAQAWWEDLGQKGCQTRDFNAQAYSLQVRNRFPQDWRERTDLAVGGPDGAPILLRPVRSLPRAELERLANAAIGEGNASDAGVLNVGSEQTGL